MSALASGVSSAAGARRRAPAARRVVATREGTWSGLRSRASTTSASVAARPAIASRPRGARARRERASRRAHRARLLRRGPRRAARAPDAHRPANPRDPHHVARRRRPNLGNPSDPASVRPRPRRAPRASSRASGPFARLAKKLKLFLLYALGWTYKTFRVLFSNRWFLALFTVFVASGSALGVKAYLARRAGARPAAAPVVLYSHFVKDLAAKRVRSVRFEEGHLPHPLHELAPGAVSSRRSKPSRTTTRPRRSPRRRDGPRPRPSLPLLRRRTVA